MNFTKYDKYKDSGLEWIGEIPADWELKRVKDFTQTQSGTTPQSGSKIYYENGNVFWIRTTDLNNEELFKSEYKVTEKAFEDYSLPHLKIDSVLIAMYGGMGTIGKNALLKIEATINQSVCAILPKKKITNAKFLLYFLQYFRPKWEIFADSARKDPNINQDAIKNLFTIIPPIETQITIASYLDEKTTQIDKTIKLLQAKKEKYLELRKTLINEAVTKGLDKTVDLKESGIEWLGKIPKHWQIVRIKDFTYVKGRIGWQGLRSDEFLDNTDYFCVTGTDFKDGEVDWKNCYCVEEFRYNQDKFIQLKINDLLITKDGSIGKLALIKDLPKKTTLNSGVFVTRPLRNKYKNSFMFWLLSSSVFKNFIDYTKNGSTILHLYQNVFERFFYALPPIFEQIALAEYINKKTSKIDTIVTTINKNIETLKELRKTMINDAVTGKIKVIESENKPNERTAITR